MKVTVLGSGTGVPSVERCSPGYLLEADGQNLLIDCGSGILRQLERIALPFHRLDALFISHTHADHIGDLTALVHAFRMPGLIRKAPFHLYGPSGFIHFFNRIVRPVIEPPTRFPFSIEESSGHWLRGELHISTCPTVHSDQMESVAFRFDLGEKSIVFSGDCDVDHRLVELSHQADILICDCSTLASGKVAGHLSALEAGKLARQAGVKKMVPTHFYPLVDATLDGPSANTLRREECAQHYAGPIILAEDFLVLTP